VLVTFTAAYQKIWSPVTRIGFLAQAAQLAATGATTDAVRAQIFNNRLDAVVCGAFMLLVAIILLDSLRLWFGIIRGTADRRVVESPFVATQLNPEEA
jgi:carbon starvation protein